MKQYFKFFVLIISLGMFLMPKDNLMAKSVVPKCCKSDSKKGAKKACCIKKNSETESSTKHKESCKSDCCKSCITCSVNGTVLFTKDLNVKDYLLPFVTRNHNAYVYLTPHFDNHLKEIWQPPKI